MTTVRSTSLSSMPAVTSLPSGGAGEGLASLLAANPRIKTCQDLINHFYSVGGNTFDGAARAASGYGLDLNDLTARRSAAASSLLPAASPAPTTSSSSASSMQNALQGLLSKNPSIKTNQDLINYFLNGRDWNAGAAMAKKYGADLNKLVANRSGSAAAYAASLGGATTAAPATPSGNALQKFLAQNPSIKTNQDLINYYLRAGGDWNGGAQLARQHGADLNALVANRSGSAASYAAGLSGSTSTPSAPSTSNTTPTGPVNPNPGSDPASLQAFPIVGRYNIGYDAGWNNFDPKTGLQNSDFSRTQTDANHVNGHLGVDIFAPRGQPVVAPVDGVVVNAHYTSVGGNCVTIRKGDTYFYLAHLDSIASGITPGATVKAGTVIGANGDTGSAKGTAPHVHFSIYKGDYYSGSINPFPYLKAAHQANINGTATTAPAAAPTPAPAASPSSGQNALQKLLAQNPGIRTNQDLINHFMNGRDWSAAASYAKQYGADLNKLVANRSGSAASYAASLGGSAPASAPSTSTPAAPTQNALQKLIAQNPSLKTNQDLINHFMNGRDWNAAASFAKQYGADLNKLVANRSGSAAAYAASLGGSAPTSAPATSTPAAPQQNALQKLVAQQGLKTNQDLINYFMNGRDWNGAASFAQQYGADLNRLVANRSGSASAYAASLGSTAPANGPASTTPVTSGGMSASKVPFISQYSPSGAAAAGYWNGPANCGPTSMAQIARAFGYGSNMSDARLINHLGSIGGTSSNGTSVNGIAVMARAMGKSAVTRGPGANVDWITQQLREGKLVVANGDYFAMPPHQNEGRTSGHYVTVAGLDSNGNFIVRDPADANVRTITRSQMAHFINSNPNGGWQVSVG